MSELALFPEGESSVSTLELFTYGSTDLRVVIENGEPRFVASDVCRALNHSNPTMSVRGLDDDERGLSKVETPSGVQSMVTVSEAGLYALIIRSNKPEAKAFRRWITHDVIPSIRRTGSYGTPRELSPDELVYKALVISAERVKAAEARAEVAESFKTAIEANRGIAPRLFHKKYFSDTPEREFFELLYDRKLLIDQRGTRKNAKGEIRDGYQHRHPTSLGKQFFYLHASVSEAGYRFEATHVRPGGPELALVNFLSTWLKPSTTTLELEQL